MGTHKHLNKQGNHKNHLKSYRKGQPKELERLWGCHGEDSCYCRPYRAWRDANRKRCETRGYTVIPFTDLIIPEQSNLIKALHAIRPDLQKWLHEGVEFGYGVNYCKITDNKLYMKSSCFSWYIATANFVELLLNPGYIKPLPRWTTEEQEDARNDLACTAGFDYVSKDAAGNVELWTTKPELSYDNREWLRADNGSGMHGVISPFHYPSLNPGECEALSEIAGGGS